MPRFHFHLVSDCARVPDSEGVVLADAGAARREAFLVADELAKPGLPAQHRKWQGWSVQLVDERGGEVLSVPIVELGAAPAATREDSRDAAPRWSDRDRARAVAHPDSRRLAAEAQHHAQRCRQLQRSIAAQVELARETARLSAQLIEQWRSLAAATTSSS